MHFLDKAKIHIKAGNGGNGCISFRREKFIEFGGPNGGNGGDGGNVYLITDPSLNTLIDFRYQQHFKAQNGKHGKGKNLFGAKGKDLIISVPNNTLIWNENKSILLAELNQSNSKFLVAQGGKGGKGNSTFKSSTNQTPKFAELGTKGEELWIWLELQLFADVGLIGFPNAGKSTILSIISKSKTKIANYPFSTLIPHLGVVKFNNSSFIVADVPGLIEGASSGKGLGFNFLVHANKCKVLLHIIDANSKDFYKEYITINNELNIYNKDFAKKPQLVVINKIDSIPSDKLTKKLEKFNKEINKGIKIVLISALKYEGISELLKETFNILQKENSSINISTKKTWSPV